MPEPPVPPSYEELAALVAAQTEQLTEQATLIEAMRVELAALRRQVGRDSSNSSQPPSQDGPDARAKARAEKRALQQEEEAAGGQGASDGGSADQGGAAKKRKPGGQRGHRGTGLARVADPQHIRPVEPPACGGCGAGLAGAPGQVGYSVQVFDLPSFCLEVTEYLMMRRVCGCGQATTADAPPEVRGGPTCYGPQVAAATAWLASQDVIGIERAAEMMAALLGAPVSTGYVSACLARLDTALTSAGFEDELKGALREQDVLGTDETPAPLTATAAAADQDEDCSNPQVFTVRTMRDYTRGWAGDPNQDLAGDLVWFGAAGTRTKKAITSFEILDSFAGVLVRDDFGGYVSYDKKLAGVQQCLSHLLRYLDDAYDIDPATQMWAHQVADALRTAIHAVNTARRTATNLDLDVIAAARRRYDQGVAVGISINLSRPWHKGNHPGLVLAKRLQRKANQVWLFTTRPHDVPPTNNGSEAAIRGFKLAEKVQGCWRSLTTLRRHCRIRSYITSARNHGRRPIDAIRDAFTGTPWMPPRLTTATATAA